MAEQTLGAATIPGPNGREYRVLFSNRAIADAERTMGKGIMGVLNGFSDGASGVTEVAALLQAGMEADRRWERRGGKRITLAEAYDILDEVGFTAVSVKVFEAVGAVLSYDAGDETPDDGDADPN